MWSLEDITDNDRFFYKVEYKGNPIESDTVIASVSSTSSVLLSAVTDQIKPEGSIVVYEYTLNNPLQYSLDNDSPDLSFSKTIRFDVSTLGSVAIINIDDREEMLPYREISKLILEITKGSDFIVLNSVSQSLFISKDAKVNDVFTLSTQEGASDFPAPNILSGVAANLMIESVLRKNNCNVYTVIEEDSGVSINSIRPLYEKIKGIVVCEEDIVEKALEIYALRNNDLGMMDS